MTIALKFKESCSRKESLAIIITLSLEDSVTEVPTVVTHKYF